MTTVVVRGRTRHPLRCCRRTRHPLRYCRGAVLQDTDVRASLEPGLVGRLDKGVTVECGAGGVGSV
jgi:hypothetical protein